MYLDPAYFCIASTFGGLAERKKEKTQKSRKSGVWGMVRGYGGGLECSLSRF